MAAKKPTTRARAHQRARRYAPAEPAMQRMLDAAEQVLIRDGYHAFSTRRVAAECGVSLGHLTYDFPAKDELLRAMISAVMARYGERMRMDSAAAETRTREDLRTLLDWLLRDTVTKETSGLFRELWVLAKHDAVAARAVLQFYESLIESFVQTAAQVYPSIEAQRLRQIGHVIGMLTEGGTVLFAGPGERSVDFEEVRPMAIQMVMQLLEPVRAEANPVRTAARAARSRKQKST
jgi:AcrR family transcriptional regulator